MGRTSRRRATSGFLSGIAVALLLVAAGVGGLWLWGKPRAHVGVPTASASPQDVVERYVDALDKRDFTTATRIAPTMPRDHWWSLQPFSLQHTTIGAVSAVPAAMRSGTVAQDAREAVVVDTTTTIVNAGGSGSSRTNVGWSFTLVRESSTQPWHIADQGQG